MLSSCSPFLGPVPAWGGARLRPLLHGRGLSRISQLRAPSWAGIWLLGLHGSGSGSSCWSGGSATPQSTHGADGELRYGADLPHVPVLNQIPAYESAPDGLSAAAVNGAQDRALDSSAGSGWGGLRGREQAPSTFRTGDWSAAPSSSLFPPHLPGPPSRCVSRAVPL